MTRQSVLAIAATVCWQLVVPIGAAAQRLPEHPWSHGTNLEVSGGAADASQSDVRGALGGAIGWDINTRVSVKGAGTWLVAAHDDEGFAAELKALANLTRPNVVVPFVGAGVGLYRASFGERAVLPDFYRVRAAESNLGERLTFTDPAFVVEGGAKIVASRHISVRPDVGVRIVTRSGSTYALTMAAVHVTYHFEVHDEIH